MSEKNNGGPAFPVTELDQISGQIHDQHMGVTMRDYFAAKALAALIGGRAWEDPATGRTPPDIFARWASAAYQTADAMLAERAK